MAKLMGEKRGAGSRGKGEADKVNRSESEEWVKRRRDTGVDRDLRARPACGAECFECRKPRRISQRSNGRTQKVYDRPVHRASKTSFRGLRDQILIRNGGLRVGPSSLPPQQVRTRALPRTCTPCHSFLGRFLSYFFVPRCAGLLLVDYLRRRSPP